MPAATTRAPAETIAAGTRLRSNSQGSRGTGTSERLTVTVPAALLSRPGAVSIGVIQGTGDGCQVRSNRLMLTVTPSRGARLPPSSQPRVRPLTLQSWQGWVGVEPNLSVIANRAAVGASERLTLTDLNGGELQDGDQVNLQGPNGRYFAAEGGGRGCGECRSRSPQHLGAL